TGAKPQCDRQPEAQVRGRANQRLGQSVVVREGACEQGPLGNQGIGARGDDLDGADEKAADHRNQGDQDRGDDPATPGGCHQAAPAMRTPTRSRSASSALMTATMWPR